jgi:hypothetical protein
MTLDKAALLELTEALNSADEGQKRSSPPAAHPKLSDGRAML